MTDRLTKEKAQKVFEDNQPPEDAKIKGMTPIILEATIDPTPQPLNKLMPYTKMALNIPSLASDEARIVLLNLFECFDKAGFIAEGLIGDLMWGFAQVQPPIAPQLTFKGLCDLEAAGYIRFQAKDNTYINKESSKLESAWVRYTDKLKKLVYAPQSYVLSS